MGEKDAIEQESGVISLADVQREPTDRPVKTPARGEAVDGVAAEPTATSDPHRHRIVADDFAAAELGATDSAAPEEVAAAAVPDIVAAQEIVNATARSDRAGADDATGDDPSDAIPADHADATETQVLDRPASESAVADDPVTIDESSEAVLARYAATEDIVAEKLTEDVIVDDAIAEDSAADAAPGHRGSDEVVAYDAVTRDVVVTESGVEHTAPTATADVSDAGALAEADGIPIENFEPPARASAELKAILEALIFASPEPLSLKALTKLLDSEPKEDVASALVGLKEDYERPGGLQLVEVAGGYQIVTRHDLHEWVRRLFHERSTQKLSAQALETLAVVAYRQPITAVEITEIRGVNTSGVLNTLLERHLIKIVGRKAVVGRPFMYSTTKEFLIRFGLNDLSDLPRVEDMVDALGLEAPLLVERAPLEDQLPLEEPDADSDDTPGESHDANESEVLARDESDEPEGRGGPAGSGGAVL